MLMEITELVIRKEGEHMGGWLVFSSIMYAAGTIGRWFL